jgi:hypothetical protein
VNGLQWRGNLNSGKDRCRGINYPPDAAAAIACRIEGRDTGDANSAGSLQKFERGKKVLDGYVAAGSIRVRASFRNIENVDIKMHLEISTRSDNAPTARANMSIFVGGILVIAD